MDPGMTLIGFWTQFHSIQGGALAGSRGVEELSRI